MISEGDLVRVNEEADIDIDGVLPGFEGIVCSIDHGEAFIDFANECPYGYQYVPESELEVIG